MAHREKTPSLRSIGPAIIIKTPIFQNLRFTNGTYGIGKDGKVKWSVSNEKIIVGAVGIIGLCCIAATLIALSYP